MAVDIEEQKVTPSEHKNLFIILSLFNVFVGFFLLLAKVNSNNVNIALV